MPLIIIWRLGPTAAAYFTLPWLILMGITLLLWNVASSFVVEVASNRGHPEALLRRSLMIWGAIVLGAFLICVLGARPLLEVAGAGYAVHGETLLRLLGLSVPFTALGAICATLLWLEQRVWLLAACQAVAAIALLLASFVLVPRFGLPAVGLAMITTQALLAAGLAPLAVRRIRSRKLVVAGEPVGGITADRGAIAQPGACLDRRAAKRWPAGTGLAPPWAARDLAAATALFAACSVEARRCEDRQAGVRARPLLLRFASRSVSAAAPT